jgi:hypothetical protein
MEPDRHFADAVRKILETTGITAHRAAIAANVSPHCMKVLVEFGQMPQRSYPRLKIARWVAANANANRLEDVRLT